MSKSGTIHWATHRCSAAEATATLTGTWTVFVSSPTAFHVRQATNGGLSAGDTNTCFQLQAFDGNTELRWLDHPDGGRASWLSEQPDHLPYPANGSRDFLDTVDNVSVLWGQPTTNPLDAPISTWREARVGDAHYPCPPGTGRGDRAVLRAVEYISTPDPHGNVAVFQRRLVQIDVVADLL
jgi:CRISPR-associated protein (TIGR03984 family)